MWLSAATAAATTPSLRTAVPLARATPRTACRVTSATTAPRRAAAASAMPALSASMARARPSRPRRPPRPRPCLIPSMSTAAAPWRRRLLPPIPTPRPAAALARRAAAAPTASSWTATPPSPEPLPDITSNLTLDGNGYTITGGGSGTNRRMVGISGGTKVELTAMTITNFRKVGDGGAINIDSSGVTVTIRNSALTNNTATVSGGAIKVANGTFKSINNIYSGNSAHGHRGGAIYMDTGSNTPARLAATSTATTAPLMAARLARKASSPSTTAPSWATAPPADKATAALSPSMAGWASSSATAASSTTALCARQAGRYLQRDLPAGTG